MIEKQKGGIDMKKSNIWLVLGVIQLICAAPVVSSWIGIDYNASLRVSLVLRGVEFITSSILEKNSKSNIF